MDLPGPGIVKNIFKGYLCTPPNLQKQAITCKLAGIEMDTCTANARFSFPGVVSMKKKEHEEEVSLTIPLWSKIQDPQIGSQTPQHWFNTPLAVMPH